MSFAGFNVTFGLIPTSAQQPVSPAPIDGPSTSSENMAAAGTSTVSAATPHNASLRPYASLYSQADAWVTIGPTPADPSVDKPEGGRRLILAATMTPVLCNPGDKVRWASA